MNSAQQLELAELKRAWIDEAEATFDRIKGTLGRFTADRLHAVLTAPPHENWIGCLVARLRNTGKIRECGRVKSTRPERNGAKISVWEVFAGDAADRFHPKGGRNDQFTETGAGVVLVESAVLLRK